jgi:hypothetical protein
MANEAEIAGRTDLIAKAMVETNRTMRTVLHDLGEVDKSIGRHLEDVQRLTGSAGNVRGAENAAEQVGAVAQRTRDPQAMDRWSDADMQVRRTFGQSQIAAGELSSRIGSSQRDLEEIRDKLAYSSGRLDQALEHLDALDRLPEYGGSAQSTGLRTRLEQLKVATARADAGVRETVERLGGARKSAAAFENSQVQIGESRHSRAVAETSESLRTKVTQARTSLRDTGNTIYDERTQVNEATQYGINQANESRAAQQDPELVDALRAGSNPTPQSAQHLGRAPAEQDLRHRLDGPAQDASLNR